jgi:hypothetical protein
MEAEEIFGDTRNPKDQLRKFLAELFAAAPGLFSSSAALQG